MKEFSERSNKLSGKKKPPEWWYHSYGNIKFIIKIEVIRIQLISLKARREAAMNFCMNNSLRIEVELLDAQIKALEKELDNI